MIDKSATETEEADALPSIDKKCIDCGEMFTLSAGERRFFRQKGLHEPKRCDPCRKAKREQSDIAD